MININIYGLEILLKYKTPINSRTLGKNKNVK